MKIGVVCRFPPEKDGIAHTYHNLIAELKKSISLVAIGTEKSDADYKIDFKSFRLKKSLAKIIEKEKLDMIHLHYIAPFYGKYTLNINLLHALSQKIPMIVELHEVQYTCKGIKKKILCAIEKAIVKKAGKIIVHTQGQKQFLEAKYHADNIECIYMGITQKNPHVLNKKNILFFGILSKLKGIEYLIQAMDNLPEYNLRIVASMPDKTLSKYSNELKELIKTKTLKNTEFISKEWFTDEEKDGHYHWADIIALPYIWGSYQSAVAADAVSYGLPILVTKTGAIWEMVDKFKCGVIIEPKKSSEIAKGIKKIFSNYEKYQQGIMNYRDETDWRKISSEYIRQFKKILQNNSKLALQTS